MLLQQSWKEQLKAAGCDDSPSIYLSQTFSLEIHRLISPALFIGYKLPSLSHALVLSSHMSVYYSFSGSMLAYDPQFSVKYPTRHC